MDVYTHTYICIYIYKYICMFILWILQGRGSYGSLIPIFLISCGVDSETKARSGRFTKPASPDDLFVTRGALAHRPIELPGQGGWGGCDSISALSHRGRNCPLLISRLWEASWNSDTDCVEEKQTGGKSERFMYTLQRYKSGIVVRTVKFGNSGFTARCNRRRCPGLYSVVPPHPQLLIKEFGRVQLRCRWGKQMSSACCE